MRSALYLLPVPRHLALADEPLSLAPRRLICLTGEEPWQMLLAAQQLQSTLRERAGVQWEIVAGALVPAEEIGVVLSIVPGATSHAQGYQLTVGDGPIHIVASTAAGVFYGVQTLRQIVEQRGRTIPALRVSDWPDLPNRGVMVDISRDKVPTMETLYALVDMLASWKINQLQLYTEHTFAYRRHPKVWAAASPMTAEEILLLDAYCRARFVELVPNQNSFGHMERWLALPEYVHLAEAPHGSETVWGPRKAFGLYPDETSLEFLRELYDELLPNFSSNQFNVGCDETIDLGKDRSRARAAEVGVGRIYLDFLLQIDREVRTRGYTMQFWGDIIVNYPELVRELPRDVIALEWGYEANHPFDEHGALFAGSGIPFYVCPGTGSWNSITGRTANAVANLRNAAENGLRHGAVGMLNTDWGDYGHWQPLPVSNLGFAYGAALAWACAQNRDLDLPAVLSRFAFRDRAQVMGRLAYELGNVYQLTGLDPHNSTVFFRVLQASPDAMIKWLHENEVPDVAPRLRSVLDAIDSIMAALPDADMARADAALIRQEFTWAANMLRHACWRAIWVLGLQRDAESTTLRKWLAEDAAKLVPPYHEIWHARNRPGGFQVSLARLERMRAVYAE